MTGWMSIWGLCNGVQTVYFAPPDDSFYDRTQQKAIQEVKKAIDNKRACFTAGYGWVEPFVETVQ